jgi:hypothetical protein
VIGGEVNHRLLGAPDGEHLPQELAPGLIG